MAFLACVFAALPAWPQAFKASPTAITFNYQLGAATLPASQNASLTGGTSSAPLSFMAVVAGGNWLTMSPGSGVTPVSAKVSVNPSTLAVGTYTGSITITPSAGAQVVVTVTLIVKAPPSTLTPAPNPVNFSYRRGDAAPDPIDLRLSTSGAVLSFAATSSGGSWFTIGPKSGMIFPGFPTPITVTVNPVNLAPGTYRGNVTINAPQAANKTQTVQVILDVGAGPAVLDWIFPAQITAGAGATTITLSGDNFYSGTVLRAGSTTLSSTLIGANVMIATLSAPMLATASTLGIVASNPGADGGDSSTVDFEVVAFGPTLGAGVNAASFLGGAVAPGEMLAIFGTGMGPDTLTVFTDPGTGPIATSLSGTRVLFDTTAAPIIYTSATQLVAMTPYDVAGKTAVAVSVEYSGVQSPAVTFNVADHAPALFTAGGAGSGHAAALNFDASSGVYTINTETVPVLRGSVVVFYATGEGVTTPASTDGALVAAAADTPNPAISVQVGGKDATILYTGGVPGLVAGLLQVNARIAADTPAGKAVPVVLTINGVQSRPGVTIGVK